MTGRDVLRGIFWLGSGLMTLALWVVVAALWVLLLWLLATAAAGGAL